MWLKKTRSAKLVPHYFTFHYDTNIKAGLAQNKIHVNANIEQIPSSTSILKKLNKLTEHGYTKLRL